MEMPNILIPLCANNPALGIHWTVRRRPAGDLPRASVLSRKYVRNQSPTHGPRQGAFRREWPSLAKGRNAALAHVWGSPWARLDGRGLVLRSLDGDAACSALARLAAHPVQPR